MAKENKGYSIPRYIEDYYSTANMPFERSMLGQMQENQNYVDSLKPEGISESDYVKDYLDSTLNNPNMQPTNQASPGQVLFNTAFKPMTYKVAGQGVDWVGNKMVQKQLLNKGAGKFLTKAGTRFIPGAGWVLAAADLIDYFGYPIYDHLPESVGNFMTWRDTTEKEEQ